MEIHEVKHIEIIRPDLSSNIKYVGCEIVYSLSGYRPYVGYFTSWLKDDFTIEEEKAELKLELYKKFSEAVSDNAKKEGVEINIEKIMGSVRGEVYLEMKKRLIWSPHKFFGNDIKYIEDRKVVDFYGDELRIDASNKEIEELSKDILYDDLYDICFNQDVLENFIKNTLEEYK